VGDRISQIGKRCASRDGKRSQNESSDPSPAAKKARQTVLDAAAADPLSDSQLERVVRLALGKRVPVGVEAPKAVVACAAAAKVGGDDAPRTPGAAFKFARIRKPKRRLETEDESENRSPGPAGAGELPPAAWRDAECNAITVTGGCAGVTCGAYNTAEEHSSVQWNDG
jgi:hypothetical protein